MSDALPHVINTNIFDETCYLLVHTKVFKSHSGFRSVAPLHGTGRIARAQQPDGASGYDVGKTALVLACNKRIPVCLKSEHRSSHLLDSPF